MKDWIFGMDKSFEGLCFIGYHSGAGTDGNPLAHTMSGNTQEIRFSCFQATARSAKRPAN